MFCGGGFELSLVFRACFVGALLDRGLGPPVLTVAVASPPQSPSQLQAGLIGIFEYLFAKEFKFF